MPKTEDLLLGWLFLTRKSITNKQKTVNLWKINQLLYYDNLTKGYLGLAMELDQCIKGRRSVRAYTNEPVTKEQLDAVLHAGVWAPTGMGRQPWRFIIIENKDLIKLVSDETKELVKQNMPQLAEQFSTEKDIVCYNAPMLVLVCAEKDPQWQNVNLLDSVLATQNMFLKAFELGLGTCYMGFVNFLNVKPELLRKLGVPENYEMLVPFIIGHPKAELSSGKRNEPNIAKWAK